ncbi:MAG: retropepsin-like aspartic protease family protein [Candidatus Eutrophobiaceae bacterium]
MNFQNWQRTTGMKMTFIASAALLGLLAWLFHNYFETQERPNQDPLTRTSNGHAEVILKSNRYGHYIATVQINGMDVDALMDTGATLIAIPGKLAQRLGLQAGSTFTAMTAAGETLSYATKLDSIRIGNITQYNVRASILPEMPGNEILLGMNFLKHLRFTHEGNFLILREL